MSRTFWSAKEIQTSGAALTNPPVLDMTLVKSKEDLQARKEVIIEFITASKDLRDFCERAPNFYRQELMKHKLTPERGGQPQKVCPVPEGQERDDWPCGSGRPPGQGHVNADNVTGGKLGQMKYIPETGHLRFQGKNCRTSTNKPTRN